jgi:hypothetical protein
LGTESAREKRRAPPLTVGVRIIERFPETFAALFENLLSLVLRQNKLKLGAHEHGLQRWLNGQQR